MTARLDEERDAWKARAARLAAEPPTDTEALAAEAATLARRADLAALDLRTLQAGLGPLRERIGAGSKARRILEGRMGAAAQSLAGARLTYERRKAEAATRSALRREAQATLAEEAGRLERDLAEWSSEAAALRDGLAKREAAASLKSLRAEEAERRRRIAGLREAAGAIAVEIAELLASIERLRRGITTLNRQARTNIRMLSGGEKGLTALAPVFAFFLAKSGPLCVLDEIDAPLDDASIERFIDLMAEVAARTGSRASP